MTWKVTKRRKITDFIFSDRAPWNCHPNSNPNIYTYPVMAIIPSNLQNQLNYLRYAQPRSGASSFLNANVEKDARDPDVEDSYAEALDEQAYEISKIVEALKKLGKATGAQISNWIANTYGDSC